MKLRVVILAITAMAVLGVGALLTGVVSADDQAIPTVRVSSPNPGELSIDWSAPENTTDHKDYRVSWSQNTNGIHSYTKENTDEGGNVYPAKIVTSHTVTGLQAGTYYVALRARYNDGAGPWKVSSAVDVEEEEPTPTPEPTETPKPTETPELDPGAITGLTMTSSQPRHLYVSWNQAEPEPTEYRLNWAPVDQPFPAWNSNKGGNLWREGTALDFSNLVEAGVTYKLRMRAIYKTGPNAPWSGPWSEVMTQRVRNHPPAAPTDLSVDSATHDGVVLIWSAPTHSALTGYRILRGSSADALETIVEDTGSLELTYTDTTTADDATHHYAITALSLDGDGRQSGTVSATTPPRTPVTPVIDGAPSAPSTLVAALNGSGGITLSWDNPSDSSINGYRILRGNDAASMRIISENTGTRTISYTDASALVNLVQTYAVQARNDTGLSQLSNTVSATSLGAPTGLETSAAYGRVSVSWSMPQLTVVTGYQVLRGTTDSALQQVGTVSGRANTFYTDFSVSPVSTYHYAVRALSAQGSSPQSATTSTTTQPVTAVSRFLRFDEDDEALISLPQTEVADTTLVSNDAQSDAVKHASDGTTSILNHTVSTNVSIPFNFSINFRTGPQPGGYNLASISASLANDSSDDSDGVQRQAKAQVRVLADNDGFPGTVLHNLSEITLAPNASLDAVFTAQPNTTLSPNTAYWAQFDETSSTTGLLGDEEIAYRIPLTRDNLDNQCSVPGWQIGNDRFVTNELHPTYPNSYWGATDVVNQGPAAVKFTITGSPADGSVSENRCHDLPQADTTTGELPIDGAVIGSLYPDSLDPTDRDWLKVTLEANVLYQFDVFHSRRVNGREGTTIGSARVHRILDSTGAAVTSGVSYKAHQLSGVTGDRTFFTPAAAGAYYLEVGVGSKKSLIGQLDQLVNWGTCTGRLPDPTRQVQGDHYTVVSGDHTYRIDKWRHPNYDGWWEQVKKGSEYRSCKRMFDFFDIRNGGVYYVTAKVADEYTADTSTSASIAPGGYLTGGFYQDNGSNRDEDWVKVNLTAGTTYRFTHQVYTPYRAAPTITGIYDSGGTLVQGPVSTKYNAPFKIVSLEYTPTATGIYYVGLQNSDTSDRNRGAAWSLTLTD